MWCRAGANFYVRDETLPFLAQHKRNVASGSLAKICCHVM